MVSVGTIEVVAWMDRPPWEMADSGFIRLEHQMPQEKSRRRLGFDMYSLKESSMWTSLREQCGSVWE